MAGERNLWRAVRAALAPHGRLCRVEDRTTAGTPDVLYRLRRTPREPWAWGWLELKALPRLPARAGTPVRVRSLTLEQVLFLEAWDGHLLLRVSQHYFLLDATGARALFNRELTFGGLLEVAAVAWRERLPARLVVRALMGAIYGGAK